jgi:AAA15 family ATPase/GTPase
MLVSFSVSNFTVFREKATLNMLASNYDKETRESENIRSDIMFDLRILKSAVIYGANASGKSKFLEALNFMKTFVIRSSKDSQKGDPIEIQPFRLSTVSEFEPTEMEVIFTFKGAMFRYGFSVTQERVIAEWLYHRPKTKEVELFYREGQKFTIHKRSFSKGDALVKEALVRNNALMLSVAAQFNDGNAGTVLEWFKGVRSISGLAEEGYQGFTVGRTKSPVHKEKIMELLKAADFGIEDIALQPLNLNDIPKHFPKEARESIEREIKEKNTEFFSDVLTTHWKFDELNAHVDDARFSLEDEESSGTKKFFALTGPVLDSIENGYVLVVDELDSKLHPNLVCRIVSLFNSAATNPKNAQLIFNTHDTNLLKSDLFRRDQIWFTQKNRYGASSLYSLSDFKSEVRKTDNFEENYIRGKYGAVPYLGDFDNLINEKIGTVHENEK